MPSPQYSIVFSAQLSSTADTLAVGTAVIRSGSSYVVATAANRGSAKSEGIALTAADSASPAFEILSVGTVDATTAGLAAGSASWVRVSSTGTLERCTPSGSDDVCGYCEADGTFHALFGILTPTLVNGGSSVTTPISLANGGFGADVSSQAGIPKVSGGSFTFVTAPGSAIVGTTDSQALTNKTIDGASNTLTVRLGSDVSGTLGMINGGFGSNVSAQSGLPSFSAGSITWKTTPSGTIVGTSDSQTLTNKVLTSPTLNGTSSATSNDTKGTETNVHPVHVQTTDATVTTLDSFTLGSGTAVAVSWLVSAIKSDASQAAAYSVAACFRNNAGTVSQVGTTTVTVLGEDDSAWDATADNSGTTIRLRITGKAATTIQWSAVQTRLEVIP